MLLVKTASVISVTNSHAEINKKQIAGKSVDLLGTN